MQSFQPRNNIEVFLPVCIQPGQSVIEVPLHPDTTTQDVIDFCLNYSHNNKAPPSGYGTLDSASSDWWNLVADFQGYEKRFTTNERLYQLTRKHILLAGNVEGVKFYLRKKKKRFSICSYHSTGGLDSSFERSFASPSFKHPAGYKSSPSLISILSQQTIPEENNDYFSDSETAFNRHQLRGRRSEMASSSANVAKATQYKLANHRRKNQVIQDFRPPAAGPMTHHYPATPIFTGNGHSGFQLPADYQKMNYAELVKFAEQQRMQIDKNNALIQQKEAKLKVLQHNQRTPQAHAAVQARLQAIRQEVSREEKELARLRAIQGQVENQRQQTTEAKSELDRLQDMFTEKERELRQAVTKVDSLKTQLETLRNQRRSAATAAAAMASRAASRDQKLANQQATLTNKQAEMKIVDNRLTELVGNLRVNSAAVSERPKATIEPFKVTPPARGPLEHKKLEPTASGQPVHSILSTKGFTEAFSAVQEVLNQQEKQQLAPKLAVVQAPPENEPPNPDSLKLINGYYSSDSSTVSNEHPPLAPPSVVSGKLSPENASLPTIKANFDRYTSPFRLGNSNSDSPPVRRQPQAPETVAQSPSPPRQYANSNYIHSAYTKQGLIRTSPQGSDQGSVSSSDSEHGARPAPKVSMSISRRLKMQQGMGDMLNEPPPPDLIPQSEIRNFAMGNNQPQTKNAGEDSVDAFYQHVESDKIHIRSDTLRAAKRRSWAQEGTNDEAEHIRRVLRREQMRGRSHINLSWIFGQMPQAPTEARAEPVTEAKKEEPVPPPPQPEPPQKEITPKESSPEPEIRPPPPYEWHIQQNRQTQQQLAMTELKKKEEFSDSSESDDAQQRITVIDVDPEIQLPPPPAKGILRIGRADKEKRSITFDPLALLLDAALEGELDLVKQSAQRLTDVSTSNDEGITALHNAICAGHYEIVRFLVEANADVNSQDSDGWTPLHCAASCNNLPMVKFLVERGACVFATTVSDHETPADKCEEDEDGFDGCSQFLISIQEKMGHMNDSRTFAAFCYDETDREDEIIFVEGQELTVLNRSSDSPEKGWWWCRHEGTKKEGYVPRNYLALYPRLAAQKAMQALKEADKEEAKPEGDKSDKRSSVTSHESDKENDKEQEQEKGPETKVEESTVETKMETES